MLTAEGNMLTADQKAARKHHVTASNVACLFDVHPFRSSFDYWAELVHDIREPDDFDDSDDIDPREMGSYLESGVLSLYAAKRRRKGDEVEIRPNADQKLATCKRYPLLAATIDAEQTVNGVDALVEAKTEGGRPYNDRHGNLIRWNEKWADGPPLEYQAQAQCQLMVTGLAFVTIPVLILSERKIVWHDVYPHEKFQSVLAERAEEFWNKHVLTGIPPEPTDYAKAVKLLPKLVPERSGTVCLEGDAARELDATYRGVQAMRKEAQDTVDACDKVLDKCKYKLSEAMGTAAEAVIEATGTTYKVKNIRVAEKQIARRGYEFLRVDVKTPKAEGETE